MRLSLAGYKLIVTEKPDTAARIATALDINGKPGRKVLNGIPYYEAEKDRKHLVVVPALGHLYTVTGEKGTQGEYPVFSYRWVPLYVAERGARRVRVWLETIAKLAKDATEFVDACDFDVEGSIIGYTILKYACGGKDANAKRMKYSTLTREDLEQSYADMMPTLDFCPHRSGAGEARSRLALRHKPIPRIDTISEETNGTLHDVEHGQSAGTHPQIRRHTRKSHPKLHSHTLLDRHSHRAAR